jgi:4-amino-4-deoxy-L-arabinose transferase-like glycosyltransferase
VKIRSFSANRNSRDILLIAVLLVFFLGLIPPAASFVFYSAFPEHHYTDAAIPMFRSNDFLTPIQHDGSARLLKPPLTYWLMIGTYKLFGVSAFSSRLVFLLGGCATILLAYRLVLTLTASRRIAGIAALILLSQPLFIAVSIRSLPDILLTFWILLSGYGFIRLICLNNFQSISYWMAYGGAAIAVETKGLLALVLVAYALAFAYATASAERPFRKIINLKIAATAVLIASAGFLLMFGRHGDAFLQSFWGDQVGQKLDLNVIHIGLRIAGFLAMYLVSFLPWLFCLGYLSFRGSTRVPLDLSLRRSCLFGAGWALLISVIFAFGNLLSQRYVLPGIPFLAVAGSILLGQFSENDLAVALRPLNFCFMLGFLVLAIFGLLLFQETGFTNYGAVLAVFLLVASCVLLQLRKKQLSPAVSFSFSYFLFWPLVFSIACPFKVPDESAAIASALKSATPPKSSLILVGSDHSFDIGLASRVRIASEGLYPVYRFEGLPKDVSAHLDHSLLILSQSQTRLLPSGSFELRQTASALNELSWSDFIFATLKGDAKTYLAGRTESYYTATPVHSN